MLFRHEPLTDDDLDDLHAGRIPSRNGAYRRDHEVLRRMIAAGKIPAMTDNVVRAGSWRDSITVFPQYRAGTFGRQAA